MLIEEETKQINQDPENYSKEMRTKLQETKAAHKEAVKILEKAMEDGSNTDVNVKLDDIYNYRDKLFSLKHNGTVFQDLLDKSQIAKENEYIQSRQTNELKYDLRKLMKMPVDVVKGAINKMKDYITGSDKQKPIPHTSEPSVQDNCTEGIPSGRQRQRKPPQCTSSQNSGRKAIEQPKEPTLIRQRIQKFENNLKKMENSMDFEQTEALAKCAICEREHQSEQCDYENVKLRMSIVNVKEICPLCLMTGHTLLYCVSDNKCDLCSGKHASVLCLKYQD